MLMLLLFALFCALAMHRVRASTRARIRALGDLPMPRERPLPRTPPGAHLATREHAWRNARRSGLRLLLVLAVPTLCASCAPSTADARVRGALDILADVIDPASELAAATCLAEQEASASEAEAGRITADEAATQVASTRARCDVLRVAFEAMRAAHDQARAAVERGDVAKAEAELGRIRDAWQQLKTGSP